MCELRVCIDSAVQSERDQIRVRRPTYNEAVSSRPGAITVTTLHRAEILSREVVHYVS